MQISSPVSKYWLSKQMVPQIIEVIQTIRALATLAVSWREQSGLNTAKLFTHCEIDSQAFPKLSLLGCAGLLLPIPELCATPTSCFSLELSSASGLTLAKAGSKPCRWADKSCWVRGKEQPGAIGDRAGSTSESPSPTGTWAPCTGQSSSPQNPSLPAWRAGSQKSYRVFTNGC